MLGKERKEEKKGPALVMHSLQESGEKGHHQACGGQRRPCKLSEDGWLSQLPFSRKKTKTKTEEARGYSWGGGGGARILNVWNMFVWNPVQSQVLRSRKGDMVAGTAERSLCGTEHTGHPGLCQKRKPSLCFHRFYL